MFYNRKIAVIILCCLGIIIYSNTLDSSFHFDDDVSIVRNSAIRKLSNLENIWNYWPSRFITFLSFAFNYHFGKLNVFGYHLFNLIIHIGSAILVWWLVILTFSTPVMKGHRLTEQSTSMALFVALVFLAHPLQTQSVTYIYQRATSLVGFLYLLSLCLYIKSRLLQTDDRSPKAITLYSLSLFFGLVAIFTKENAATLPFMIILYEFYFLRKERYIKWKYSLPYLILLSMVLILISTTKPLAFKSINTDIQNFIEQPMLRYHYLLTQFRVMVTYLRLLFMPLNQNLDYDYPMSTSLFEPPSTLIGLFLLMLIVVCAVLAFRRYKLIGFSIFWFFLTLLPESSIIPLKDVIFEHRLYLPMVGFSLFLVNIVYYLFGKRTLRFMSTILFIIVAWYSILTYTRNFVWKEEFTLWNDVIRKSPNKARPYNERGIAYAYKGNLIQALADFNTAIKLNPNYAEAYNSRGIVFGNIGNLDLSLADFNKAIDINPNYAEAYNNRAIIHDNKRNLNQAILDFNKAVEINPGYSTAHYNLAMAYYRAKQYDLAIKHCNKAIELGFKVDPEFLKTLKTGDGSGVNRKGVP